MRCPTSILWRNTGLLREDEEFALGRLEGGARDGIREKRQLLARADIKLLQSRELKQ